MPLSTKKIVRTNYHLTGGQVLDARMIARGAKTPDEDFVVDTTHSSIIYVSTGLVSPAFAFASCNASQTGMTSNLELRWIGATGSYAKFLAIVLTGTGTHALIATAAPATTVTLCFSWFAFED